MEKHFCPLCQRELLMEHKITYIDYRCYHHGADHSFSKRIVQRTKELDRVKIRLTEPDGEKLYIQIYFQEGYLDVWKHSNTVARTRVNHTFTPDYNNPEALKRKIKMYILFS